MSTDIHRPVSERPGPQPVLVLDGDWASALAIVRSLGRRGLRVHVGAAVDRPLAASSRYVSGQFVYPDPMEDMSGFRQVLEERLGRFAHALVIPVTDKTIVPLMEVRDSFERLAPVAMASNEAIRTALSKSRTVELAGRLGIPTPGSRIVHSPEEAYRLAEELAFPVVLKPDRSKVWGHSGEARDFTVAYAQDPQDLAEKLELLQDAGPVVLQEKVRGEGVGMGVLASAGETLFTFQYRRLHEVPLSGGSSSYRISERPDPVLVGFVKALIEKLRWDGVAMVEFKHNPRTEETWLIEINGRFWGSLPLPVAAGADFPAYLFDLWVEGRRSFPPAYREGVRCRSLLREAKWLVEAITARRSDVAVFPGWRKIGLDCLRTLNPAERWDTLSWTDPKPGLTELSRLSGKALLRLGDKLRRVAACRRMRRVRSEPADLARRLRRARQIVVLCRGNIMRSAFAEALLERAVLRAGVSIFSAGLEARPGKPADPMALAEAGRRDVDLSAHRAAPLTPERAAQADVIFAMEAQHLVALRRRFPAAVEKSFLLSCLAPGVPLEIADPVFQASSVFRRCFEHVERAVAPIAELLSEAEPPPLDEGETEREYR